MPIRVPVLVRSAEAGVGELLFRTKSSEPVQPMHWLAAVIGAVAAIFVFARAVFRVASPFWSRQPVFHPYRLDLWLQGGRVIDAAVPSPDKYTDHRTMETVDTTLLTTNGREEIATFMTDHYLRDRTAVYAPKWRNVSAGMDGGQHPSFFCCGRDPQGELVSTISARSLEVRTPGADPFWVYYVDNLCVHTRNRRAGVAPVAIRTIYHDLRHATPGIQVCLFKREGATMGIMPLTVFPVMAYQSGALDPLCRRGKKESIVAATSPTEVRDAWERAIEMSSGFRVAVTASLPSIVSAAGTGAILVYTVRSRRGDISAVALLRDPACTYSDGKALELACFVHDMPDRKAARAAAAMCKRACQEHEAELLVIDVCGDCGCLVDALRAEGRKPQFESRTSLFFYNYAEKPHPPSHCALLF